MPCSLTSGWQSLGLLAGLFVVGGAMPAIAAAPSVRNIDVRGLQIGGTATLIIDGVDLLPNPRLLTSAPISAQSVRPNATTNRVEIDVTLDGSALPGLCNLYLAHDGGVSERIVVAVDRLPQRPFVDKIESLPMALHGTLNGSTTLTTSFPGKAGQPVQCEVESQRLGGKVRPVLHLYDADGRHLAWSLPSPTLRGDTRLTTTLPADGLYTLTLNDLQYAPPGPNQFRLKIGQWQYADQAFPPAVQRGAAAMLRLVGNGGAERQVSMTAAAETSYLPAPWQDATAASGPAPSVMISDLPELIEQPSAETLQEIIALPTAINGRLSVAGEEDHYKLKVQPDAKLKFELFSARLGSPVDSILELRRADGAVLAANDDVPLSTDSALEFVVPKEIDAIVVAVKDALGRGGESCIYRLVVAPVVADPARADFQLFVEQDRYNVSQQGRQALRLRVNRQGYTGPILLDFAGLPRGVAADSTEIPAGADGKLVTLTGGVEAMVQSFTTIRGHAMADPRQPIVRIARRDTDSLDVQQPWLSEQFALSLSARDGVGFDADWQPTADAKVVLGKKLPAQLKCVRPAGFDGPVRVTLLTSQNPPLVNGQIDINRAMRNETNAPNVEIPPDGPAVAAWDAKLAADKVLLDTQTAQAAAAKVVADAQAAGGAVLEAATKAKGEADARVKDAEQKSAAALEAARTAATAAKNELPFVMFVPAELPPAAVEIAYRAELLSRDRQRVLLTVCTPVRALPVVNPIKLKYPAAKVSAKLDRQNGATLKLTGQVERLEGMAGDVAVTLQGLPPGIAIPRVVLNASQTDFELELKFPANFVPGELRDIKLFGTGKIEPANPLETKSDLIDVPIELLPPDPA